MARVLLVTVLCLLVALEAHAFFDGFDLFSPFNHGFRDRTRRRDSQLERDLAAVLDGGASDVELVDPVDQHKEGDETEVAIPGFTHHEGFPGGFFSMFTHGVRGGSRGPWWHGDNVCVEREEIDESSQRNSTSSSEEADEDGGFVSGLVGSFEFSSCSQTDTKYVCTTRIGSRGVNKKFVVKYQCCHGYTRVPGKPGCTEANLKSLLDTAQELGAKEFVRIVKTSGLEEKFNGENLTLFAPTDDALRDFTDKMQQENQVEFYIPPATARRRRNVQTVDMRDIALGHSISGFVDVGELVNEQVLYSENDNSSLRINIYPSLGEARITCNCARVTSVNNMATNGIVHLVDQVMKPVTKTILELLEQDEQLATLTEMLNRGGLLPKLKEARHVTLFAPTEEAFRKLPEATMKRLKEGHSCLKRVLKHHILPHVLCSAAINGQVSTNNVAGEVVHLERRFDDNKIFLDGVQIVTRDVMATNGVIHVIDDVIVPDSAKTLSEVLRATNHTTFVDLLSSSSLLDELDAMENVTLFAPTDAALKSDAKLLQRLSTDEEALRDVLLYHAAQPEKMSCDLANDMALESAAGEGRTLKINLYASQPMFLGVRHRATAQCARLVGVDTRACGGVIHSVDRLIVPPTKTVLELISEDERFTELMRLIKAADMESVLEESNTITLLAPNNEAFERIGEEALNKVLEDKQKAAKVVRQHILPEALCCAGVSGNSWPFTSRVETLNEDSVAVRRDADGDVHIGTTTVRECDKMATNGLVHVVNRVMGRWRNNNQHGAASRIHPNIDIMLYGLENLGL